MKKMLILLGCLIYVVSPIDLIPDLLPILGWFDDGAVIVATVRALMAGPGGEPEGGSTPRLPEGGRQ